MSFLTSLDVVGDFFKGVFGCIDKAIPDADKRNQLKADLEQAMQKGDLEKFQEDMEARSKIIIAEAQSQSWIARNWRPIIMLLFGVIIANNYILNPWFDCLFNIHVTMAIPPDMWALLKLGIGGYIVGRSAEKVVTNLKK
jgi:Holin of 3TMs, for gene-transfer release